MNRATPGLLQARRYASVERQMAPSLEWRRLRTYGLMVAIDAALLYFSFSLASQVWEGAWAGTRAIVAAQVMLAAYLTIALYNGTYGVRALTDWAYSAHKALSAIFISAALVNFIGFYTKSNEDFSRATVTLGLLFSAVLVVALRRVIKMIIDHRWSGQVSNRLVINDASTDFVLEGAETISAAEYDLDPGSREPFMLDRLGKLLRHRDQVVVNCPQDRHADWAFVLKSAGIYGEIVSEPAHKLGAVGVHRYDAFDVTTLVVSTGPLCLRARILKRTFDVGVAGLALIALSPLLLGIAVLIKLEDGGPVLFVQRRLGRGNQLFGMYKFRSMRHDKLDADGERSVARGDDRVTRIGALIRRTSIDELPQIINVLKGEMSIIGPRPHALGSRANNKFFWDIDAKYWQRHCLKPGLTGLAQVRGHRGATEVEKDLTDRLQSDLEYIAGWSLWRDIGIVLRTVRVLTHRNAF